jgi:hypothetical protein
MGGENQRPPALGDEKGKKFEILRFYSVEIVPKKRPNISLHGCHSTPSAIVGSFQADRHQICGACVAAAEGCIRRQLSG